MSTSVSWPPIGGTTYSVPASGEVNWPNLSNYLIALQNAQGTAAQKVAIRTATTTPVTVASPTDCVVVTKLAAPGAVAVNLPAGIEGQMFVVVDGTGDALTNNITITPNGVQTINGAATYVIATNRAGVILVYKAAATNWTIVSEFNNFAGGSIPRSSIAAATADYVVINDGTGKLSEEQYLSKARGGAGADQSAVTYPATGVIVTEAASETLTNKSLDGNSNTFSNIAISTLKTVLADANKVIRRDVAGAVVSDNPLTNSSQIVTLDSVDLLTNKSLVDNSTLIVDNADNTKTIAFNAGGTTGTSTTITAAQTANRVLTLPDATDTVVAKATTDDLSNKSFTSTLTMKAANQINFNNAGNTQHVSLKAGTLAASTDFILPVADGTGGQFLQTDGSANLSFATPTVSSNGNVRASEGAGTTTLTSIDNREQKFDLTANRIVVLPTAGVVKGDIWIMDNPNPFQLAIQASDASLIVNSWGARAILMALVNTPVASTDWAVTNHVVLYGRSLQTYTPTLSGSTTASQISVAWNRTCIDNMHIHGFIKFSAGSGTNAFSVSFPAPGGTALTFNTFIQGQGENLGPCTFNFQGTSPAGTLFGGFVTVSGAGTATDMTFYTGQGCAADATIGGNSGVVPLLENQLNTVNSYLSFDANIPITEWSET